MTYKTRHTIFSGLGLMLGLGLLLVAAGCSSDEVDSEVGGAGQNGLPSRHAIAFTSYVNRATRTPQVDVTTANLGNFYVYAVGEGEMYMENIEYAKGTYTDAEDQSFTAWGPADEYFWPVYALTFYAFTKPSTVYSTVTASISATADDNSVTITPASALENQEDFVVAYQANVTDPNQDDTPSATRNLTFSHCMTQVTLRASNQSSTGTYSIKVDGAKITNLGGSGTYTFGSGTMAVTAGLVNSASSTDYTTTFTAKTLTSTAQEVMTTTPTEGTADGKWYLIPQTVRAWDPDNDSENDGTETGNGSYIALKVLIKSEGGANVFPKEGSETAWMAVPVPDDMLTMAKGHKYVVTLNFFSATGNGAGYGDPEVAGDMKGKKIVKGKIKFNTEVNPIDGVSEIDIDL